MLSFIGKLFVGFLAVYAALGGVGLWMKKRSAGKDPDAREEEFFSEKEVGNVHDLNDPFNRARYMDRDEN